MNIAFECRFERIAKIFQILPCKYVKFYKL